MSNSESIEERRTQFYESLLLLNMEEFTTAMPDPENYSFFPLMNGLMERIKAEIVLYQQQNVEDPDPIWLEEIERLKYKYSLCEKSLQAGNDKANIEELAKTTPKHLIFATTSSDRIYLLQDIKHIPEEHYYKIINTLISIEKGEDKGNEEKGRDFTSVHKEMAGLKESKEFKIRTFYRVLEPDLAFVIMTRIKDSDKTRKDIKEPIIRKK